MKEAGPTITVAKATGVSESSVRIIIRKAKNIDSGASTSFLTPRKERPGKSPLFTSNDWSLVRIRINDFYIVEK
jgi:hypothetical protein